ncbi:hypothetical protein [uncultured Pseudokineococcus sp.]|uniref:hypothetical protein n=1 Tax=uncultured Pseudokineococcus sp. TaxID=1642928 RepID=UPI002619D6F7|nr:hypothetical protein [uncultured Pseudokineococcus sp.]
MVSVVLTVLFVALVTLAVVAAVRDIRADGYGSSHTSGEGLDWVHRAAAGRTYAGPGPR